jgi:hypothetical protein
MTKSLAAAWLLFGLAVVCIAITGLLILWGHIGGPYSNPRLEAFLELNWWMLAGCLTVFSRWRWPTLLTAWSFLVLATCLWWYTTDERSFVWGLYETSPCIIIVILLSASALLFNLHPYGKEAKI